MDKDKLNICPKCGCDGCYISPLNETKFNYFCFGCGYTANDLILEGEYNLESYEETLPDLYKDVKYVDNEKRVWYPIVINIEDRGTVFLNGKNKDNVEWAAIKSIPLTEDETKERKYRDKTHKSDSSTLANFGEDFLEALDYIGFFYI